MREGTSTSDSGRPPGRWFIAVVVWLAAGAVITTVVAFVGAHLSPRLDPSVDVLRPSSLGFEDREEDQWTFDADSLRQGMLETRLLRVWLDRDDRAFDDPRPPWPAVPHALQREPGGRRLVALARALEASGDVWFEDGVVVTVESGWPLSSHRDAAIVVLMRGRPGSPDRVDRPYESPVEIARASLYTAESGPPVVAPLRPAPIGFTVNTLFFGIIAAALHAVVRGIPVWRRHRSGRCVRCAHRVRVDPVVRPWLDGSRVRVGAIVFAACIVASWVSAIMMTAIRPVHEVDLVRATGPMTERSGWFEGVRASNRLMSVAQVARRSPRAGSDPASTSPEPIAAVAKRRLDSSLGVRDEDAPSPSWSVQWVGAGWPFRAVHGVQVRVGEASIPSIEAPWTIPGSETWNRVGSDPDRGGWPVPWRPVWWGLFGNAAILAGILWMIRGVIAHRSLQRTVSAGTLRCIECGRGSGQREPAR